MVDDEIMITGRSFEVYGARTKTAQNLQSGVWGLLKIEDLDLFRETLTRGIGKKKALCGLLTVIPGSKMKNHVGAKRRSFLNCQGK